MDEHGACKGIVVEGKVALCSSASLLLLFFFFSIFPRFLPPPPFLKIDLGSTRKDSKVHYATKSLCHTLLCHIIVILVFFVVIGPATSIRVPLPLLFSPRLLPRPWRTGRCHMPYESNPWPTLEDGRMGGGPADQLCVPTSPIRNECVQTDTFRSYGAVCYLRLSLSAHGRLPANVVSSRVLGIDRPLETGSGFK